MTEDTKEIREKIDAAVKSNSKLWSAYVELAADYWGPNRTNGVRSEVKTLIAKMEEMEKSCRHYYDATRRETCYGIQALLEFKAELAAENIEREKNQQETEEKQEGIEVEKIKANSATTVQILTLIGVVVGPVLVEVVKQFIK